VPIANVDKASGLIVSSRFALQLDQLEAWADCGTISGGSTLTVIKQDRLPGEAYADFNVVESPAGDSTSIRVSIVFDASAIILPRDVLNPVSRPTPLQCVTNGRFETAMLARVSH
jgi:hypothetical protein